MAEIDNQQVKSKRDLAYDRLRAKHQDKQFEDDEAFFGQMNDDYDEYEGQLADRDKQISDYKQREDALGEMFANNPRSANFFLAMKDGKDPVVEFIRIFGDDVRAAIDDPDKQEEIAAANKDYAERIASQKNGEEEYKKNLDESLAYLDKIQAEGMSEEQIDACMKAILKVVAEGLQGKFTPETIDMFKKALNFDSAVKEAGEEGVIKGRNAKIEEKLRTSKKGDGHAPLGDEGSVAERPAYKPNLGALEQYDDNLKDIWERGNIKRTKY